MTRTELAETIDQDVESRIRDGVKAVIEQILEKEMTLHLGAARRERSPGRRDERNGHDQRDLITPVGKVEQLRVPRARQGEFLTEVFDRYQVNWSGSVTDLALLLAIGVNEQGCREVLVVEAAGAERKEAYRNLLKGLIERGLRGVQLVISADHESIKQAVKIELPGSSWQRCTVHFMRHGLSAVAASEMGEAGPTSSRASK